jgi:DNA repair exonuclease SbcCD ATPase subunit
MSEGKQKSNQEDLSEFNDYLTEFDLILKFDSETCPVCGVNISNSLSIQKSPQVLYKSLTTESDLLSIKQELDLKCIEFKVEKRLNSESLEEIKYYYDVLVPIKYLTELQKS